MRKLFIFVLILLIGGFVYSETLESILQKNYEARGGLKKLKAIKTLYSEGKMVNSQQNAEIDMKMWFKSPNKFKTIINLMGKTIVQAYDGEKAWWIMPFISPKPQLMPEQQAKSLKDMQNSFIPLIDYKEKGNKLEFVGEADVDGTKAYKLKMTKKNGKSVYFYLDADSGIELKTEMFISRGGVESKIETIFSDYKQVDGIYFPFYIETKSAGINTGKITFTKMELNKKMEDSFFEMSKETGQTTQSEK
jgi:outer membrane lipoprotein-sorting protein